MNEAHFKESVASVCCFCIEIQMRSFVALNHHHCLLIKRRLCTDSLSATNIAKGIPVRFVTGVLF